MIHKLKPRSFFNIAVYHGGLPFLQCSDILYGIILSF